MCAGTPSSHLTLPVKVRPRIFLFLNFPQIQIVKLTRPEGNKYPDYTYLGQARVNTSLSLAHLAFSGDSVA